MQCRMYVVGYYLVYIRSIEENVTVNVVSANDFKTVNCELKEWMNENESIGTYD